MDLNYSAIDVLYDSEFLVELEEKFLLYRTSRGNASKHIESPTTRNTTDIQQWVEQTTRRSSVYRSPSTDFEVCNFIYSFLKTQFLASTSRSSSGESLISKKTPSLEKILESRRRNGRDSAKNMIPIQQQTELVLLW